MTAVQVPIHLAVDELDLATLAIVPIEIKGADELPGLRGDNAVRSGRWGRAFLAKPRDQRAFTLAIYILSTSSTGTILNNSPSQQARATLDALYAVLGRDGQRTLTRYMPDGTTTRTALAEVVNTNELEDKSGDGSILKLIIEFQLSDAFWYGAAVVGSPVTLNTNPKAISIVHAGNGRTNALALSLVGPFANPRILNNATGEFMDIAQVGASGKVLAIDCDTAIVTYDGTPIPGLVSHFGSDQLLSLAPGTNALSVISTTTGGSAAITYSPAYL